MHASIIFFLNSTYTVTHNYRKDGTMQQALVATCCVFCGHPKAPICYTKTHTFSFRVIFSRGDAFVYMYITENCSLDCQLYSVQIPLSSPFNAQATSAVFYKPDEMVILEIQYS